MNDSKSKSLIEYTCNVVRAYIARNSLQQESIPTLIVSVHRALGILGHAPPTEPTTVKPAVPIKASVTKDLLFSLEDGKGYKALKRHLRKVGLTPDEYRKKWGLPDSYPMVAEHYSMLRSKLAKATGLGRKARRQLTSNNTALGDVNNQPEATDPTGST